MNDENNFGGSPLDEIDYIPTAKNEGPQGVSAPVLDDFGYDAPAAKKDGPQGVSAPVLDDMAGYSPAYGERKGAPTGVSAPVLDDDTSYTYERKGAPTGVTAPVLDDNTSYTYERKGAPTGVTAPVLDDDTVPYTSSAPKKLVMTDEEIIAGLSPEQSAVFGTLPADKQKQIIDMRRAQLGAEAPAAPVAAPVLDEDNYVPPPKKEEPAKPAEPIAAPVLDDEPEAPKYKSQYVDEDLERIKKEAKKKAVSSQLTSNQKDSKESLRMMLELKEQQRQESAKTGFKICIVLALIGIVGAVAFYLLYTGQLGLTYKDGMSKAGTVIEGAAVYIAAGMGVLGVALLAGIGGLKSLCSFVYLASGVVQIFPGIIMIPNHNGNMVLVGVLYAVSLICTITVFVTLSASESVGNFFKKPDPKLERYERQ